MCRRKITQLAITLSLVAGSLTSQAQKIDSSYNNSHYQQRLAFFKAMPNQKNEIVFLGNSITEAGEWQELLAGKPVVNRGISGDVTYGIIARLDEVVSSKPKKVFVLCGVNDLKRNTPVEVIAENYKRIIHIIQTTSPRTQIYMQSVLPVVESMLGKNYEHVRNEKIVALNKLLQSITQEYKVTYVNLHEVFTDESGSLIKELSTDGLHLRMVAYIRWVDYLKSKKYL
ncbi:lysophospholipase L1-like esterase [Chitinophaga skermanii]|uniref:Lysophospholipase L1-like esterase n=1 Tax=Chitinophaga skermanii TaxID=331697 RepID=A0A327R2A7_9BACT|nr:GDSL-type esterase/lipase family protein [Chitinophaga skermanii]RAJ10946.1 lysophospholipase L1-like esterase [Chitinophaga skermanii]